MLQTRTVAPFTLGLLKKLMSLPQLEQFFLVGGTALSLKMGHRESIDLDLFTTQDFDKDDLLLLLREDFDVQVDVISPSIFITRINEVKVDFVRFRYKMLYPIRDTEGVLFLSK